MTEVAEEFDDSPAHLPPAERRDAAVRIEALATAVRSLGLGQLPSTRPGHGDGASFGSR